MARAIQPGTIVRVNTGQMAVRRGAPAIFLGMNGEGVRLFTDAQIVSAARREFTIPRVPLEPFTPMRLRLAYGVWTKADSSRVLFSRDYFPLWQVFADGRVVPMEPWRWVEFVKEEWFWDYVSAPWRDREKEREIERRMEEMGVSGTPRLVRALDLVVQGKAKGLRDAVKLMVPPGAQRPHHL